MTGSSTHNDGDDANGGGGGGKEICGGDAGNNSIKPATLVITSENYLKCKVLGYDKIIVKKNIFEPPLYNFVL